MKAFYRVKPLLWRQLQVRLRSIRVRRMADARRTIWPIPAEPYGRPRDWRGWPGGAEFALVLRHDVESERGLARCELLMQAERERGVRSAFNFVTCKYETPGHLVRRLWDDGFEVGVHGVKHDGRLYESRGMFERRVPVINAYLRRWGAKGFISPAAHHRLEWMHELDIEYDSSTFDVDPFEPESDGVHTAFPFVVRGPDGAPGYVELPYTMPQDFTLFVLMNQRSIDIWKRKLDWIASFGGMVLVNSHPDYMRFRQDSRRYDEYPVDLYFRLLDYIVSTYRSRYVNMLPYQVSRYLRMTRATT